MGFGYTLALDEDGDIIYNPATKSFDLVHNVDALVQDLRVKFQTLQGEDPIHPEVGLPLLEIMENGFDGNTLREAVRDEMLDDPRIQSVQHIELDVDLRNRKASITAKASTVDGDTFDVSFLSTVA